MKLPRITRWWEGHFRLPDAIMVVGLPVLLLVLAIVDVPDEPALTLCGFRNLTGLPCPGCGMTRSVAALLKGRALQSVHFNALAAPTLLLMVMVWLRSVCLLTNRQQTMTRLSELVSPRQRVSLGWTFLVVVGVYWAGRLLGLVQ
jgi:hypothetical protein